MNTRMDKSVKSEFCTHRNAVEMDENENKPIVTRIDNNNEDEAAAPDKKRKTLVHGPSSRPNKFDFQQGMIAKHRKTLTRMLKTLYDDHNWDDCAAVLSVLLQLMPDRISSYTLMDFRKNFLIAMELLRRAEAPHYRIKVKQICEIWFAKIKWISDCPKERLSIQLELVLFFYASGNINEAYHVTKFLIQDHESANEPKVHLLHGLTSYQIWYSNLPLEMQLKDFDLQASKHFANMVQNNDVFQMKDSVQISDYHHDIKKEETLSSHYDSDSSVGNKKQVFVHKDHLSKKIKLHQTFSSDANEHSQTNEDRYHHFDSDNNFEEYSIFDPHVRELDARILPIKLGYLKEDVEKQLHSHRELLTENYAEAIRHLRTALYSVPPLLSALYPLIQVLLLGDQVGEAFNEVTRFCHVSKAALPFKLKAKLLESFCSNEFVKISKCHETVLRRKPTCSYSMERLIKMFNDGNYSSLNLLEMLFLHLDATDGNCNVWGGFSSCLLKMRSSQQTGNQDMISGNQTHHNPSHRSFLFLKYSDKQSCQLRSRWWSMRHFSNKTLLLEIQAGSCQLVTFKAACASHLYGTKFPYVVDVVGYLKDRQDFNSLSLLETHTINPLFIFKPAVVECNTPPRLVRDIVDPGWAYGTPVDGDKKTVKCNYCEKIVRGAGITRLKQHLAGGSTQVKMCKLCPENVRLAMREHLRNSGNTSVTVKRRFNM